MTRPLAIGIDIGGTKVAGGVVDAGGRPHRPGARPRTGRRARRSSRTPSSSGRRSSPQRHDVAAVGIGAAGFVDADRATVVFAPHLSWRDEPLPSRRCTERLAARSWSTTTPTPRRWAEWRYGAGRGETHLVMITLGTGIGGGDPGSDGSVQRGRYGIAGEFGHMQVVPGGHRCECGNRGCWEQYACGNALVREARRVVCAGLPGGAATCSSASGGEATQPDRSAGDRGGPRG